MQDDKLLAQLKATSRVTVKGERIIEESVYQAILSLLEEKGGDDWISVDEKDKLPKFEPYRESEEVLITNGQYVTSAFYNNKGFRIFEDFYKNDVTHHKPLPAPPKTN